MAACMRLLAVVTALGGARGYSCPAGYYDTTSGNAKNWGCGSGCAGGSYTDGGCVCACQCVTNNPPDLTGSAGPCGAALPPSSPLPSGPPPLPPGATMNCDETFSLQDKGASYRGCQDRTMSGHLCQAWNTASHSARTLVTVAVPHGLTQCPHSSHCGCALFSLWRVH